MMRRVGVIVLCLGWAFGVEAATLRVSAGVDALSQAMTAASAGDTLLLVTEGGQYRETHQVKMPAIPLVIMADSLLAEKPVLTSNGDRLLMVHHDLTVRGIYFDGRDRTDYALRSYAERPNRIRVENCVFDGFKKDAITDNDQPVARCEVRHSLFKNIDATAIEFRTEDMCTDLDVEDCTFYRIGAHAIHIAESACPIRAHISNVTISDATGGIYLNAISDGLIRQSIISGCRIYGIRATRPAVLYDVCMYKNLTDYSLIERGPGCFRADPKFFDPEHGDFSLLPGSPCLNVGGVMLGDLRWTGAATVRSGRLFRIYWWGRVGGLAALAAALIFGLLKAMRYHVRRQEAHKAERALRESEAKYRDLFEAAHDVILIAGARGEILDINRRGEDLTGYDRSQLLAMNLLDDLSTPDDRAHLEARLANVIAGNACICEVRWRRADGSTVYLEGAATPRMKASGDFDVARCIFRDITERRRIERELIRLERLRSIGEMSAGVSHNLNNLLAGILLPADLARQRITDPTVIRYLDTIEKAGQRAADLIQRLHTAVRGQDEVLEAVNVNEIIQDVTHTTRPRWKDEAEAQGVHIALNLDLRDVPKARCSKAGLHDVLTNLVFNAVDAMPQGGNLTISSGMSDDRVRLVVCDTGIGMDEETRRRVFEPFFTTKTNVGTGLGLATVYGTVTGWNGDVGVESEPGKGATFFIELPTWTAVETPEEAGESPIVLVRHRVLIVEDEADFCQMLSRVLSEEHDVVTCTDGVEALQLVQKEWFDVALIDLGLPGVRGDEIARVLRAHDANAVTVLISGWNLEAGDPRLTDFDFYIKKPFVETSEVSGTIAQALVLRVRRLTERS